MNARQPWLAPHLWWWVAVVAGVCYCVPAWSGWHGPWVVVWKGAGVGLLAVHAALTARALRGSPAHTDALLLTAVMACGAMGDVLLDAISLVAGAAWFALGHLLAMALYWRNGCSSSNRRNSSIWRNSSNWRHEHDSHDSSTDNRTDRLDATTRLWPFWLGLPVALGITAALAEGQPLAGVAIGYTLLVALMAAFAWCSRFSRWLVGLGAFLFLVSDLLIFTRTAGPLPLREAAGLLVWPLYFGGQALIARGVTSRADLP